MVAEPQLTICVATRDRAASLRSFLRSLDEALSASPPCEVVIVDNGSQDETGSLLAGWVDGRPQRRVLTVAQPGKSRALNAALAIVRAELVAFTDDDVEVDPAWPAAIIDFFARHPEYAAAMGRVLLPPTDLADPSLRALIDDYRTLPAYDRGDDVCDVKAMYGANMAIRRLVLAQIGGFNEQLGPGVGTLSEDIELSHRIRDHGGRIGYMPAAVVYHAVERQRLTPEYLIDFHIRVGRSELVRYPHRTHWHTLPRLLEAALAYGVAWITGPRQRRVRTWGRLVRQTDLFRTRWRLARKRSAPEA